MNIGLNFKSALRRAILLLLVIVISLSVVSCDAKVLDKSDIADNISSSDSSKKTYEYVADYLRSWGIKNFDLEKVVYFERVYRAYYGYENGMPDTLEHAKKTAEAFIEEYYDVIDLNNKTQVTDAILTCYSRTIGDPYSIYRVPEQSDEYSMDMSGKFGGIGVEVIIDGVENTITVNSVFIDSPAEKAGMRAGDEIRAVNGISVEEIGLNNVVYHMRGDIGRAVTIVVKRGEELISLNIVRDVITEISANYTILEGNIGYLRVSTFKENTYAQFVACVDALEAAGVDGIIMDVRLNGGGYVKTACDMISYLIPNDHTIVSYQYQNQLPTVIKSQDDVHPTKKNEDGTPLVEDHVLNIPIVVLCDENTASSAEIFTAAIRDHRNDRLIDATIVGTTTYKKGIIQATYLYRADNSTVTFTIAYYNPPCGTNFHGVGISPDVEVHNSETEDLQYIAALEELNKLINANNN